MKEGEKRQHQFKEGISFYKKNERKRNPIRFRSDKDTELTNKQTNKTNETEKKERNGNKTHKQKYIMLTIKPPITTVFVRFILFSNI
jgi:hypothetical protein